MNDSNYIMPLMNRKCLLVLSLFALLIFNKSNAGTPADSTVIIRCISVGTNDSVTLTWTLPLATAGFNAYMIYWKTTTNGNFGLHDSIFNYNTITYYDPLANPYNVNNSYSYFIKVRWIIGVDTFYSIPSDTVHPIIVHVSDIGTGGIGEASVTWNAIHTPLLPSSSTWYQIYRQVGYPFGAWVWVDSTQNLFYKQPATFCNKNIAYRIEISDTVCKCTSVSSIGVAIFMDVSPPAIVVIDSVSIDPITGSIIVGWKRDDSLDTKSYTIVQRINGHFWSQAGYNPGIDSTSFISSFSSSAVDSFYVLAYDSCNNQSSQGTIQSTIHVKRTVDTCALSAMLTWNPYVGWKGGVKKYYILQKIGSGPWTIADSVAPNIYSYNYTSLTQFDTFSFRIRALDSVGHFTSSSNVVTVNVVNHHFPHFEYIKTATVLSNTKIRLDLYTDISAAVYRYNIQRSTDTLLGYTTIGWTGKYSNSQFSYIDSFVNASVNLYYYRFQVIDSCQIVVYTSNVAHPIQVHATPNIDMSNTVSWTAYSGFDGGDGGYYLYRSIDGIMNPKPIAILPFGVNTFVDSISQYANSQGEFCYTIVQSEAVLDQFGFKDSTRSNSGCAEQSPAFYIPNAFTPNGRNPIFIPINNFTNVHLYDLNIYNRLGQLIFESTDPFKGWDGTYEGSIVPMGVYIYTIIITGQNDTQYQKLGSITVLK